MVTAETYPCFKCVSHVESPFRENLVHPIENICLFLLPGNAIMLQHLIKSNLRSIICQVVTYGRLKTKNNFKLLALKVVAVAYKRFKILIVIWLENFWYFGKLVAEERWWLTRGGRNRRFDFRFVFISAVKPPHNGHFGDRGKWLLYT